ncbi:hypothetical protein HanRHA438_Chr07g0298021 [Helianthus annuus]|nr:hypothetical protein HanRHA438_Chr07g0298021 [Helianthus annuus]
MNFISCISTFHNIMKESSVRIPRTKPFNLRLLLKKTFLVICSRLELIETKGLLLAKRGIHQVLIYQLVYVIQFNMKLRHLFVQVPLQKQQFS